VSEPAAAARIACVHEWLTEWGGSEDVVRLMLQAYPQSQLYATIDFLTARDRARFGERSIHTTWLQRAPFARTRFWNYLPVTALAVESHDLGDAQVILSSSHAFAKGVVTRADQLHLSYVHSPMRYAWDLHHQYLRDYDLHRGPKSLLARAIFHRLRIWDRQTANNVDVFMANSRHVRDRIWRTYRRAARVIHPPVRTQDFTPGVDKGDTYVTVSRLVSYKRVDLIVEAFRAMPSRQLVVIGDGPELGALRARCPANVQLKGWQPDAIVQEHLRTARAFIFAAHEDFGISPVEAQACGTPVIAYGAGGSLETVRGRGERERPTGLFFREQTCASLVQAVEEFERVRAEFDPHECRAWAEQFSEARFQREYTDCVERAWTQWRRGPRGVEEAAGAL
jgi:glycosyltransferase involved in cell wall biosynthesis